MNFAQMEKEAMARIEKYINRSIAQHKFNARMGKTL